MGSMEIESRNGFFFTLQRLPMSITKQVIHFKDLINELYEVRVILYLACPNKTIKIRIPRIIKWIAPLEPFIKLNTGDSVIGNPGMAGADNLLRNNASARISGFSLNMGITSNNIAVGVVQQGLILAWELGFKFIHLEINSMTVLSWLTTKNDISPDAILLLCDCRNLVEHDWTV